MHRQQFCRDGSEPAPCNTRSAVSNFSHSLQRNHPSGIHHATTEDRYLGKNRKTQFSRSSLEAVDSQLNGA